MTQLSSPAEPDPADDDAFLKSFAGKLEGADLFRRLVITCLPPRQNLGDRRRFVACYRRMVALVYRIAPEVFEGMTAGEVAELVGLSHIGFKCELVEADKILARKAEARFAP